LTKNTNNSNNNNNKSGQIREIFVAKEIFHHFSILGDGNILAYKIGDEIN